MKPLCINKVPAAISTKRRNGLRSIIMNLKLKRKNDQRNAYRN